MENKPRRRRIAEEADHLGSELSGNLPGETILEILARLPLKSLSHFRWVCKSWYNSITSTQFAITHHLNSLHSNTSPCVLLCNTSKFTLIDHQPFDDHQIDIDAVHNLIFKEFELIFPESRFRILSSLNGLVCFYTERPNSIQKREATPTLFYVCNPITQEHVLLPKSLECGNPHDVVGFGYDSSSNTYKIIRIFSHIAQAEIYTLGSGTWRKIENVPYVSRAVEAGVFANGLLHWFMQESINTEGMRTFAILSFNLATEEFGAIRVPPVVASGTCVKYLSVIENQLCIANLIFGGEIIIWVMKDYGVDESWSKQHVFKDHPMSNAYVGPFEIMKVRNGEFLLWGFHPDGESTYIRYFDFQTKMVAPIRIKSDLICWEPFVFRGSLLSPKCIEGSTDKYLF